VAVGGLVGDRDAQLQDDVLADDQRLEEFSQAV
jgi:hypothetical protein